MAGTAEGIAKARAARDAKLAQRRAVDEAMQQHNNACSDLVEGTVQTVAPVEMLKSVQGRQLADVMIDQLQPAAVREIASALRQTKSPTLRFSAACKLLDLARMKDEAGEGSDDGPGFDRLARVVTLRTRAGAAVDAAPIRGEVVAREVSQPTEQPDSASASTPAAPDKPTA